MLKEDDGGSPSASDGVFCEVKVPSLPHSLKVCLADKTDVPAATVIAQTPVSTLHDLVMQEWGKQVPERPVDHFRLIFRGNEMKDGFLSDFHVEDGSVIHGIAVEQPAPHAALARLNPITDEQVQVARTALGTALRGLLPGREAEDDGTLPRDRMDNEQLLRVLQEERQRRARGEASARGGSSSGALEDEEGGMPTVAIPMSSGAREASEEDDEEDTAEMQASRTLQSWYIYTVIGFTLGPFTIIATPKLSSVESLFLVVGIAVNVLWSFVLGSYYVN